MYHKGSGEAICFLVGLLFRQLEVRLAALSILKIVQYLLV